MGNEQQPQTLDQVSNAQPEGGKKKKEKKPIYKRVWFWVIVVVVVVIIAASGSDGSDSSDSSDAEDTGVEATEEEATEDSGDSGDAEGTEDTEDAEEESGFEEIVLYDDDDITVTVTDVLDDWLSAGYTITIVNDSSASINVEITDVSVDGVMVDTWFYESVAAGKKAAEDLDLYGDAVDSADDLVNVEGNLIITDDDTYDKIADLTFTID